MSQHPVDRSRKIAWICNAKVDISLFLFVDVRLFFVLNLYLLILIFKWFYHCQGKRRCKACFTDGVCMVGVGCKSRSESYYLVQSYINVNIVWHGDELCPSLNNCLVITITCTCGGIINRAVIVSPWNTYLSSFPSWMFFLYWPHWS